MKRYILTGTPGSGKTTIINELKRLDYFVIDEAISSIISNQQSLGINKPWKEELFINKVVESQIEKQVKANAENVKYQFFDRSPIDTYILCKFLKINPPQNLIQEIKRIEKENIYEKNVFFIENIGSCENTNIRQISYEESLVFEKMHYDIFCQLKYNCIKIPSDNINERVKMILDKVN